MGCELRRQFRQGWGLREVSDKVGHAGLLRGLALLMGVPIPLHPARIFTYTQLKAEFKVGCMTGGWRSLGPAESFQLLESLNLCPA